MICLLQFSDRENDWLVDAIELSDSGSEGLNPARVSSLMLPTRCPWTRLAPDEVILRGPWHSESDAWGRPRCEVAAAGLRDRGGQPLRHGPGDASAGLREFLPRAPLLGTLRGRDGKRGVSDR